MESKDHLEIQMESDILIKKEVQQKQNLEVEKKQVGSRDKTTYFVWNKFDIALGYTGVIILSLIEIQFFYQTYNLTQQNPKMEGITKSYFGLYKDTSDFQWNAYSSNLPILMVCALIFLFFSKLIRKIISRSKNPNDFSLLMNYFIIFGILVLIYLFRSGFLLWLILVSLKLAFIEKYYKTNFFQPSLWLICIFSLFFINLYLNSLKYSKIFFFLPSQFTEFLDEFKETAPVSWISIYNMTVLRIISFGVDKQLAFKGIKKQENTNNKKIETSSHKNLKQRIENSLDPSFYNIQHFFAYLFYTPIFLTGPPATFNSWVSQIYEPQTQYNLKQKISYTIRCISLYLGVTVYTHLSQSFALSTLEANMHLWQHFSVLQLTQMGFNTLIFIWLKFDTIWKISRCWALWDNVEVHENMNRCVNNNYNQMGFWRAWHRGFNQWLIRYLFVPLGGSKSKHWSVWIVFTFVALWHELDLDLLFWAWGICLIFVPEQLIISHFQLPKYSNLWKQRWWLYVCSLVAGFGNCTLIVTNLIGFGVGYKMIIIFFKIIFESGQILQAIFVYVVLCLNAIGSFRIRHFEGPDKSF